MTNKEIAQKIFSLIEKKGFIPYDIEYGNTYFIMTGDSDSIVHFRVKGVSKHWKFGMWLNAENIIENIDVSKIHEIDDKNIVQFFAQYDTDIDKFKPSRSKLCVTYSTIGFNSKMKSENIWEIIDMLKFMKRHFFLAYSGLCGEHAGYISQSFVWNYIKHEGIEYLSNIKCKFLKSILCPYTKLKIAISKNNKIINKIIFEDFEKEHPNCTTDYKYGVQIEFKENVSEEEMLKFLNKWFKKERYGKLHYWDSVIFIQPFRQIGRDYAFFFDFEN